MKTQILNPQSLYNPTPYGYSHMASVQAGSHLVFVAGQGGEDREGNLQADFRAQVKQAFANIQKALAEVHLEMKDIVKLSTLIVDYDAAKHQVLIEESRHIWPDKVYPAQTLIPVPKLALEDMLFEVEAIAVKA
ncbi:RidA family protein [Rapidithrix thailandica]|uniref:RidA family protein n=1 Tax=Rapidithrix thailandica TaxID=413964 RepID=A0AAW9S5H6_9BACT